MNPIFTPSLPPTPLATRDHRWMLTASGRQLFPTSAWAADIFIEDIAAHLSKLCRFCGACNEFYSVAQHSVIVSRNVPAGHALTALLHDAPEALGINDVAQPVKQDLHDYQRIESSLWLVVAERFGLPNVIPSCVKAADRHALMTERRDLMPKPRGNWSWGVFEDYAPFPEVIVPLCWRDAEIEFLVRFQELTR